MADGSMIQRSFAGGELAPALNARADQVKYQTGLSACRNFIVRRHGGVSNRCGSGLICEAKDSAVFTKAKKFVFNADQTYSLLFGHQNMRVVRQGVLLTVTGSPAWSGSGPYAAGDLVSQGGVQYYCRLANTGFIPPNATYWYPLPADGTYEIPTPYNAADVATLYIAQSGDVISIDHQAYPPAELRRTGHTNWVLTNSLFTPGIDRPIGANVTIGNGGAKNFRYRIAAVSASGEESLPALGPPKSISAISQANPCVVTATNHQFINGDEVFITDVSGMTTLNGQTFVVRNVTTNTLQLDGIDSRTYPAYVSGGTIARTSACTSTKAGASTITAASQGLPCQITTSAGHGLTTGDTVYLESIVGMIELNGGTYTVTVIDATNVTLDGIDSTAFTAYAAGGTMQKTTVATAGDPTAAVPHIVQWTAVSHASQYNVYREVIPGNGVYGFIGSSIGTVYNDTGSPAPDANQTPPLFQNLFNSAGNYPATVGYFAQRRMHGDTVNNPESVVASRPGQLTNFSVSSPLQDDDAASWTLVGKQVNEIRHIVDIGNLIILTSGSEWVLQGDGNGAVTPSTPGGRQYSYNGSSTIPPIIVGANLLYVQARGNLVRDFRNTITQQGTQGYLGDDLTVFASHLFEGRTIVAWDYQQIPNSTIYVVMSDGAMLCLTYLKEHDLAAWSRLDTNGAYEDVLVVPEGNEDAVYVWVRRTINGQTRRYYERFASRIVTDVAVDARFLDSYLTYDGRNTSARTMTVSGGTTWTHDEQLTLTASTGYFQTADVGSAIRLWRTTTVYAPEGSTTTTVSIDLVIEVFTSTTVVTVRPAIDVDATLRNVALTTWGKAVTRISGLSHLEGQTVGILADGQVVTNGLEASGTKQVAAGAVELDRHYLVIHAGLPYVCDLQTLDLDVLNGETLADKRKRVSSVTLNVEQTRGLSVCEGAENAATIPSPSAFREIAPDVPDYGEPIALVTGKLPDVKIDNAWNLGGRVFVRQRNPLPATILAIVPHVELGG